MNINHSNYQNENSYGLNLWGNFHQFTKGQACGVMIDELPLPSKDYISTKVPINFNMPGTLLKNWIIINEMTAL